jgi:hypothetical protein
MAEETTQLPPAEHMEDVKPTGPVESAVETPKEPETAPAVQPVDASEPTTQGKAS